MKEHLVLKLMTKTRRTITHDRTKSKTCPFVSAMDGRRMHKSNDPISSIRFDAGSPDFPFFLNVVQQSCVLVISEWSLMGFH